MGFPYLTIVTHFPHSLKVGKKWRVILYLNLVFLECLVHSVYYHTLYNLSSFCNPLRMGTK